MVRVLYHYNTTQFKIIFIRSDKIGFRKLFIGSFFVSVVGGALYTAAYQFGDYAVFIIGMSRVLTGIGAANSVLTYCYVARVVPHEEQTLMNTLLGMAKIIGMAGGPSFNVFLAHINIHLWDGAFVLDSLNSVGLLIMFFNFVSMMSVYFLLEEPEDFLLKLCPFSSIHKLELANKSNTKKNSTWIKILSSILCPNIIVPFCSIFAFNATFQLVETGITPAMSDGLGWKSKKISGVFGSLSIMIALGMVLVSALHKMKLSNEFLLRIGLMLSVFASSLLYLLWERDASLLNYYIPLVVGSFSFPFLMVPAQTIYTIAVDSSSSLKAYQGTMQAALSMGGSVAGFTIPTFVAKYCVRSPQQVSLIESHREMSEYSLLFPILCSVVLLGALLMENVVPEAELLLTPEEMTPEEQYMSKSFQENTPLLIRKLSPHISFRKRSKSWDTTKRSPQKITALHQSNYVIMGIPQSLEEFDSTFDLP